MIGRMRGAIVVYRRMRSVAEAVAAVEEVRRG